MWNDIVDWFYVTLRQLHIVKCNDHGWTYLIDNTENDIIQCPVCGDFAIEGTPKFKVLKNEIISWTYNYLCSPNKQTRKTEVKVKKIINRNLRKCT